MLIEQGIEFNVQVASNTKILCSKLKKLLRAFFVGKNREPLCRIIALILRLPSQFQSAHQEAAL